jgi:hypothetical protein
MSTKVVSIGPGKYEICKISRFSRFKKTELYAAWRLIGPSADLNLNKGPIWKVIAAAYLEGLHHGSSIQEESNHD